MGRFDALTQIEEKQEKKTPLPEAGSPITKISQAQSKYKENVSDKKPAKPQTLLPASPQNRLTANPQARKTANQSPTPDNLDKPEKYTTRLEPSLVKKVRLHAIEKDIKDYEVVRNALNQYFEKNS
jgi:hypothetical protein